MYDTDSNVIISGAKSGISTTLNGAITNSATTLTLTSVSLFPSSATSGSIHLKIDDEIMTGTISGTGLSSLTRGADGTTATTHSNGATVELYQINNVPLTEINKTHTTITNVGIDSVIDLDRRSIVAFTNRLNNIDSSSDVFPTSDYIAPTEPDGDSNETIYCTKRVTLQNPATSIKVLHSAVRFSGAEIQLMYKILRSDDASDFDEIGWRYFNSTGGPDTTVNESTTADDFIEYEYTQNDLEEFIAFAIKIRMQGVNSSEPPRIKDLRAIALAT